MDALKSYAMYLRKSRADLEAEAHGEGETLARHRAALTELAARKRLTIDRVYSEIVSGDSIAARPEMQRLLTDVGEDRYAGVLVMEVERLARGDTIDQGIVAQTFRSTGTLIVTPYRTYDPANEADEDYFEFSLFMARREYKAITRRMQAGRVASVREGKYVGPADVYGYRRVKLPSQKGWTLEVVPEQARIVRLIFTWYAYGMEGRAVGMGAIARRLNDMGIPAPRGGAWTRAGVGNLLHGSVARGYVTYNKRVAVKPVGDARPQVKRPRSDKAICVRGLHEPIVEQALVDRVRSVLAHNRPAPATGGAPLSNPLAGLVFCAACGHAMTRVASGASNTARLACKTPNCPTVGIRLEAVERAVLEAIADWRCACADAEDARAPERADRLCLQAADENIASLENQLRRVHGFLERGLYGDEEFVARRGELTKRLASARAARAEILSAARETRTAIPGMASRVHSVLRLYASAETAGEKNALLKSVLSRVLYAKTVVGSRSIDAPDCLSLVVYPSVWAHAQPDAPRPDDDAAPAPKAAPRVHNRNGATGVYYEGDKRHTYAAECRVAGEHWRRTGFRTVAEAAAARERAREELLRRHGLAPERTTDDPQGRPCE